MEIEPVSLDDGRRIGDGYPVYVIAEIGSNHDGDLARAERLIRLAAEAGADAVKFQSFQVAKLINKKWLLNGSWAKDPLWDKLEALSLPHEWYRALAATSRKEKIDFLSTPFDLDSLHLLLELDVPAIKIASGDITYWELIRAAAASSKPLFISTGHAVLGEVESALAIIRETGCADTVLMHCVSCYPTAPEDVNIYAIKLMREAFLTQVGFSDHTLGIAAPLGAVAFGARIIEKHFTDDRRRPGPDHPFALDCAGFANMVTQIRDLEKAMRRRPKEPCERELVERTMARRAVYAVGPIAKGSVIKAGMTKVVRHAFPGGIAANRLEEVYNKTALVDIEANQMITEEMIGR